MLKLTKRCRLRPTSRHPQLEIREEGTLVQALKGLIKVAFQEVVTGIRDPMIMMINMDETDTKLF